MLKNINLVSLLSTALLALAISQASFADSVLTNSSLRRGYEKLPERHEIQNGILTAALADKLAGSALDIGSKIVLVNALGVEIEGKNNAAVFAEALVRKYGSSAMDGDTLSPVQLNASELAVYGYMLAMDNYFQPVRGVGYLEAAHMIDPQSRAIAVARALVRGQLSDDISYLDPKQSCAVWKEVIKPFKYPGAFKADMKREALLGPLSYLTDVSGHCK